MRVLSAVFDLKSDILMPFESCFFPPAVSAVVLKTKIICLSGCPSLGHVDKCSQD